MTMDRETASKRAQERLTTSRERETKTRGRSLEWLSKDKVCARSPLVFVNINYKKEILEERVAFSPLPLFHLSPFVSAVIQTAAAHPSLLEPDLTGAPLSPPLSPFIAHHIYRFLSQRSNGCAAILFSRYTRT